MLIEQGAQLAEGLAFDQQQFALGDIAARQFVEQRQGGEAGPSTS
jgi:hypothetical protein